MLIMELICWSIALLGLIVLWVLEDFSERS